MEYDYRIVFEDTEPDICFEGVEKKLILEFTNSVKKDDPIDLINRKLFSSNRRFRDDYDDINPLGLRHFDTTKWTDILKHAKCKIISHMSNDFFDSYVLSESSLFVYPKKIIIKTCGTTTLLLIIEHVLDIAKKVKLELAGLVYSHKSFKFPKKQQDFDSEVKIIENFITGNKYEFGTINKFYLYVATVGDYSITSNYVEIMMEKLNNNKSKIFYKNKLTAKEITNKSGILNINSKMMIDDYLFDPCGYSMNGIYDDYYSTIHVTPENNFSYASYETNTISDVNIAKILNVFNPKEYMVVALINNKITVNMY